MKSELKECAHYFLPLGAEIVPMNPLVGQKIKMTFKGVINCVATGERIKKSYGQGYSYKAFSTLAECDSCIVKPELCHFAQGTCRNEQWGRENCFIDHILYLSVTDKIKVGITRHTQVPTRWIDQGASCALAILKFKDRKNSGIVESEIAKTMSDRTNWRKMLGPINCREDLFAFRDQIYENFGQLIDDCDGVDLNSEIVSIDYPVIEYPRKIVSWNFDKDTIIEGELKGIKGQYLLFSDGVINMRKHQGYHIELEY